MTSPALLQKRLLSIAAKSRRSMHFANAVWHSPSLAQPAYGLASPMLVVGALSFAVGGVALDPFMEVLIADPDRNRSEATKSQLAAHGFLNVRAIPAEPNNLRLDLLKLSSQWDLLPPLTFDAARKYIDDANHVASVNPLVPDRSISVVYCSGFDVRWDAAKRMEVLRESFRVLRNGGVVRWLVELYDELDDLELMAERTFTSALASVGFYGVRIVERSETPLSVANGRELRSYVIDAFRGKEGPCLDCGQSVIYRGPWRKVFDDDGHTYERDERTAVCEKTFRLMTSAPYSADMIPVEPYVAISLSDAKEFDCASPVRAPAETKGLIPSACTVSNSGCC
jgi:arsenite methyltransferase